MHLGKREVAHAAAIRQPRITFQAHPSVYLMPHTIYRGDGAALMKDGSSSNISWADVAHGGCPGTVTFASQNGTSSFPEALIGTWPISRLKIHSGRHRLRIAQSPFLPFFVSAVNRGAALMIMFRITNLPVTSTSTDLIEIKGAAGNNSMSVLWLLRLNPEDGSLDCVHNAAVTVSTSPGRIRDKEWFVAVCELSVDAMLSLHVIGGDESAGSGGGGESEMHVYDLPSRNFELEAPEVEIGHARSQVDLEVAAVVIHDQALSGLEKSIIREHMLQQLDLVYPDAPGACPGEHSIPIRTSREVNLGIVHVPSFHGSCELGLEAGTDAAMPCYHPLYIHCMHCGMAEET